MPSIRAEMRLSQKLSPEIIGPSLETATEILHSAYSKRTRQTQKVICSMCRVTPSCWVCCSLFVVFVGEGALFHRQMNEHDSICLLTVRPTRSQAGPC